MILKVASELLHRGASLMAPHTALPKRAMN
jgi:hypothetical protein